jgi:hypothetical protein
LTTPSVGAICLRPARRLHDPICYTATSTTTITANERRLDEAVLIVCS